MNARKREEEYGWWCNEGEGADGAAAAQAARETQEDKARVKARQKQWDNKQVPDNLLMSEDELDDKKIPGKILREIVAENQFMQFILNILEIEKHRGILMTPSLIIRM